MKAKDSSDKSKKRFSKIRAVVPPVASRFKKPNLQQQTEAALENVPRITNETVAEHREEVLKGARKYKYPLQHSKHKIVIVSSAILVLAFIVFMLGTVINLYQLQSTSKFMYRVTQVVPFPVAKVGDRLVSYENYLFEMRRYMHYYRTQQQVDFESESGKIQLDEYKPRAMQRIVDAVYVKELAEKHKISVSDAEVRDALNMLRTQNRLKDDKDLSSVIKRFYDWSIDDLKRELRQEILAQKVAAALDHVSRKKAEDVLTRAQAGETFEELAKQFSDDEATKTNGGVYADTAIAIGSQDVPHAVVRELPKMKAGEVSNLITTPTSFEIVKLLEVSAEGKYKAAHIEIRFKPIANFTEPVAKRTEVRYLIDIPPLAEQAVQAP